MIEDSFLHDLIKKPKKISKLNFADVSEILKRAREIFEKERLLLEFDISEPDDEIYVIGDIHGNLETLKRIIRILNKEQPKLVIFLGDIVDRGKYQIECLIMVLALKILFPERMRVLRGNHETMEMNEAYGFFYECIQRFNDKYCVLEFLSVYDVLPLCAIINNSILCLHGGIPDDLDILKKLKELKSRNIDDIEDLSSLEHYIFQIMWNDPREGAGNFSQNIRGPGIYYFGEEAFNDFMEANNLKYLIRAHEVFPEGYRWFFNNRLLSIFSSANYRGMFYPNPASYAIIKNGKIIPKILELL